MLGFYAENLVFNALKKWEGTISVNYFREKQSEIDFIIHTASQQYLPVEVKYRETIKDAELKTVKLFCKRFKTSRAIIVTKNWDDFRRTEKDGLILIPLPHFLLLFD